MVKKNVNWAKACLALELCHQVIESVPLPRSHDLTGAVVLREVVIWLTLKIEPGNPNNEGRHE